ncbi:MULTISPECIES: isopenicillin N synthase family oxygenase [unclassified Streptomyces]|jgi:isopenicillin N synthase-like dioxygenase|uniref:isopenicillin N synthase family oxygenase n=1 Tax=unclassified Streptomyces TaxID=2593676 RepID=UPI001BB07A37|nr:MULTISPECIES: isopenicillin N synthase family oxygenase [unclassified Streptomyces]MDH6454764.1 isopenicillin N synthase-like dioxygenase [Streptomyces sp. SAI-119]MDH6494680.1 isopenicillin N synthase-like dioxygenase [Streptomyces sp. SAI-149]QUC58191.1 isopenicillin N synthase family oxygenase [Streptomyces sp. A2-16]GLP69725.1 1-aminocyclopropane-1-carboxylate deaminase [Streptomyces sp. TUS-ST3]
MTSEPQSPLQTFRLPTVVRDTDGDRALGRALVAAWQRDGIFQVHATLDQQAATERALAASRAFCRRPLAEKTAHVSDLSYSGYVASGEEETAGQRDGSEIFTVCPDIPADDPRVIDRWPCHGPAPWPSPGYARAMKDYMKVVGEIGHRLLRLTALGLGLDDPDRFTRLTTDGWHHMRVLRFPPADATSERGIGAHTDYGLLVIAAQDDVGGLYVRPPVPGEERGRNWLPGESMAGRYEHDEPWTYVTPVPAVLTVFPGDIMQFMTGGALLSTPHKVRLAARERYTLAYFHEPAFNAVARPLDTAGSAEHIHYGTHFTRMFMRCYPQRVTTARIEAEGRLKVLDRLREEALA